MSDKTKNTVQLGLQLLTIAFVLIGGAIALGVTRSDVGHNTKQNETQDTKMSEMQSIVQDMLKLQAGEVVRTDGAVADIQDMQTRIRDLERER